MYLPVINISHDPEVLLFDVKQIRHIREEYGILGTLIGTLPPYPQQNVFLSVPLKLTVYEVMYLVEKGAVLVDYVSYRRTMRSAENTRRVGGSTEVNFLVTENSIDQESDVAPYELTLDDYLASYMRNTASDVHENYRVFRRLRNAGYFVSPGLKFGGDFVIYPGDPLKFHSYAIVKLGNATANDILVGGRLATSVKKHFVLVGKKEVSTKENQLDNQLEISTENQLDNRLEISTENQLDNQLDKSIHNQSNHSQSDDMEFFQIQWAGFG